MATKAKKEVKELWAVGRRKTSIARVRLSAGDGTITVNEKPANQYFGHEAYQLTIQQPFKVTETIGKFNVAASLTGGGTAAQADALQHGISRALVLSNADLRKALKTVGLLTRDSREKERRKVGCRKARKRPQYSKR